MLSPHLPRSAASARLLLEVAVKRGMTTATALRGTGLTPSQLADSELEIRSVQEEQLIRNMVAALGDDDYALVAGGEYSLGIFGMLGFACMSSPTMRGVLEITLRYQDLLFTLARAEERTVDATTRLTIDTSNLPHEIRRFVADHGIATAWHALTDLNGEPIPNARVALEHPRPSYWPRYEELLGFEPTFDAGSNWIDLESSLLDRPRPQADPVALEMCERDCRALLNRRREQGGFRGIVYDRLSRATGVMPSMTNVASDIAVSVRTLRRALEAEQTTFRAIDELVRRERAERLLIESQLSVEQIATSLGYATSAAFVRAFRRWHDTTPGKWRRESSAPT